jgi:hypothetical protein
MSNEKVMQDKSFLKVDDDIEATTNKIIATVREIKINRYSYMTLLFLFMISFSLNIGLFFFYHAQVDIFEQRELALNAEIQKLKENAR